jgi:hypothetical protein
MNSSELAVMRKTTTAFIAADYVDIIITRGISLLPKKRVRLIPQQDFVSNFVRKGDEAAFAPRFILLAEWNADIREDDKFTYEGVIYIVTALHDRTNKYEFKADIRTGIGPYDVYNSEE